MSIAAYVTGAIGPGSTIALFTTNGLGIGEAVEVAEQAPTGGWLRDPYRDYDDEREERVRRQRIALGILPPEEPARPTLARRKEAAPYKGLDVDEASRLIDALEAIQRQERARRIAAILLLAA